MAGATTTAMPYIANAMPRLAGGNVSARMACSLGCKPPPPVPCRMRKKISMARFGARPHRKRTDGEQRHAHHVEPLAPDQRGKPAAHGQHDGVGHQIGSEHPGAFVLARRKAAGDVRQRDVGDAGIQHFHERGQRHRQRDHPRVDRGLSSNPGRARQLPLELIARIPSVPRTCPAAADDRCFRPDRARFSPARAAPPSRNCPWRFPAAAG